MKDWTEEVREYTEKIKDMDILEAYDFLWQEYYFKHNLSKKAHEWIVMFPLPQAK